VGSPISGWLHQGRAEPVHRAPKLDEFVDRLAVQPNYQERCESCATKWPWLYEHIPGVAIGAAHAIAGVGPKVGEWPLIAGHMGFHNWEYIGARSRSGDVRRSLATIALIATVFLCTGAPAHAAPEGRADTPVGTLTVAVATFGNERWLPHLYVGAKTSCSSRCGKIS